MTPDQIDDADLYATRRPVSAQIKREADRLWNEIPDHPDDIAQGQKRPAQEVRYER